MFKSIFMVRDRSSTDIVFYRCRVCGETFQYSGKLVYHSYIHSEEWPHKCSFCNKGFALPSYWKYHLKRRDTIKEIDCLQCLKRFRGKYCPGALASLEGRIYCESCSTGSSPIEYVTS
ncbi:hypothetical protein TNIN_239981 [Trichonephila inaurata madagascariensis]|uniref:C2H2-type domain-containing protein n=1 Tax=Trichonephila inaurata madagascariensis TaxID=2747483 RepID=A0A8X7C2N5_9ARAC|nr:hypothetical protein TNIN_239981 [Trichonephila inaurata madagascariensis]